MRQFVLGSLVAVLFVATSANAGDRRWYMALEGGIEYGPDGAYSVTEDVGYAVLGTLVMEIGPNLSLEGELGYRSTSVDTFFGMADIDQTTLMVNAVYGARLGESVSLSLGAGVGVDNVGLDYPFTNDSSLEVAAQVKIGLNFEVSERMDVIANLRYLTTFETEYPDSYRDVENVTITLGLKFDL